MPWIINSARINVRSKTVCNLWQTDLFLHNHIEADRCLFVRNYRLHDDRGLWATYDGELWIVQDHFFTRSLRGHSEKVDEAVNHWLWQCELKRTSVFTWSTMHWERMFWSYLNRSGKSALKIGSNAWKSVSIFIENILRNNKINFDHEYLFFNYCARNININPRIK